MSDMSHLVTIYGFDGNKVSVNLDNAISRLRGLVIERNLDRHELLEAICIAIDSLTPEILPSLTFAHLFSVLESE